MSPVSMLPHYCQLFATMTYLFIITLQVFSSSLFNFFFTRHT
jgi:hypothetical protein